MKIFSASHVYPHPFGPVTLAHWNKYPNPSTTHVLHVDILSRAVDPATGILRTERLITCKQTMPSLVRRIVGGDDVTYALETSELDPTSKTFEARSVNLTYAEFIRVEERCRYSTLSGQERQEAQVTNQHELPKAGLRHHHHAATTIAAASPSEPSSSLSSLSATTITHTTSLSEQEPSRLPRREEVTVFEQEARIHAGGVLFSRIANMVEELGVSRFRENAVKGKEGFEGVLDRLMREGHEFAHRVASPTP